MNRIQTDQLDAMLDELIAEDEAVPPQKKTPPRASPPLPSHPSSAIRVSPPIGGVDLARRYPPLTGVLSQSAPLGEPLTPEESDEMYRFGQSITSLSTPASPPPPPPPATATVAMEPQRAVTAAPPTAETTTPTSCSGSIRTIPNWRSIQNQFDPVLRRTQMPLRLISEDPEFPTTTHDRELFFELPPEVVLLIESFLVSSNLKFTCTELGDNLRCKNISKRLQAPTHEDTLAQILLTCVERSTYRLALICRDFTPKQMSRLVAGLAMCDGLHEVTLEFFGQPNLESGCYPERDGEGWEALIELPHLYRLTVQWPQGVPYVQRTVLAMLPVLSQCTALRTLKFTANSCVDADAAWWDELSQRLAVLDQLRVLRLSVDGNELGQDGTPLARLVSLPVDSLVVHLPRGKSNATKTANTLRNLAEILPRIDATLDPNKPPKYAVRAHRVTLWADAPGEIPEIPGIQVRW